MQWDFRTTIISEECSNDIMGVHRWRREKENKIAESYEFIAEEDYLSSAIFVIVKMLRGNCVK